jgi:putative SOS response-associated peptidase YedK
MCYSAQIEDAYDKYVRRWGADIDIDEFVRLYFNEKPKAKTPKAMDAWFDRPESEKAAEIKRQIGQLNVEQAAKLEQELFKQKKRLADAERTLLTKTTKKAQEDKRISSEKIEWCLGKLNDLRHTIRIDEDARIFPGWYAPVMVVENGKRVVKPMRYQCRLAGSPASNDFKFPGTYNARRDNLEGFWRRQFGYFHGIMIVNAFYENVSLHNMQHRELALGEKEQNVVLEFRPQPKEDMLVACLWSRWRGAPQEPELLSFAAITDEPPTEIAAAGHDRCIIPIKPEHVDAWLNPHPNDLKALYAILDDRERPYYEHRLAA